MKDCGRLGHTYDLRVPLRLQIPERVVEGIGGGALLSTFIFAHLGREVALARKLLSVDAIPATEALDLLPSALGGRLRVPTSFVGTDEVTSALHADPLASDEVAFKAFKVGLWRLFGLFFNADNGRVNVSCTTATGVSDKSRFLRMVGELPGRGWRKRGGRNLSGRLVFCWDLVLICEIREGGKVRSGEVMEHHRVVGRGVDTRHGLTMSSAGCTI